MGGGTYRASPRSGVPWGRGTSLGAFVCTPMPHGTGVSSFHGGCLVLCRGSCDLEKAEGCFLGGWHCRMGWLGWGNDLVPWLPAWPLQGNYRAGGHLLCPNHCPTAHPHFALQPHTPLHNSPLHPLSPFLPNPAPHSPYPTSPCAAVPTMGLGLPCAPQQGPVTLPGASHSGGDLR